MERAWNLPTSNVVVYRRFDAPPGTDNRVSAGGAAANVREWFAVQAAMMIVIHDAIVARTSAVLQGSHDDRREALVRALEDAFARGELVAFSIPMVFPVRKVDRPLENVLGPQEPAEEEEVVKTWFEVTVVDVFGDPIPDAEVAFTHGNTTEKIPTNGSGVARWDGATVSFATARLQKLPALRDALKTRWGKGKKPVEPKDPDASKQSVLAEDVMIPVESETKATLVLYRPLTRIRLLGLHFETNKSFVRPSAMHGIKRVVTLYKKNPTGKLLILGHTDTTADDKYNLDLSVERAKAVEAYLKDDVPAWEAWFGDGKPSQKRWGNREVMQMISALPCEQSVKGFQSWSNETRGTSLTVDGVAGPLTRKALIEAYMALDDTTLPKSIGAVIHGCGEFFPRTDEGDQFGKDGVAAEENRRVEMICFPNDVDPPVPGEKATKGEPEYAKWLEQVTETIDVSTDATEDTGKIFMELWNKLGEDRLAGVAYEITGDGDFSGTTDGTGRLLHTLVPNGLYRITVTGRKEDSAAIVLENSDTEPQIRFLQ